MRKIVKAALACSFAVAAAVPAGTALAAPNPVAAKPAVVVPWNNGWTGMKARPSAFYFGQGAAPYLFELKWKNWRAASAYGTGKLHIERVLCEPTAAPGCTTTSVRWASVTLTTVKRHAGKRYFAKMTVRFWSKGKELTRRLTVKAGYWTGPSVWPDL